MYKMLLISDLQAELGEKKELTFEEFQTVMSAYRKDLEKAQLEVTFKMFSSIKLKTSFISTR